MKIPFLDRFTGGATSLMPSKINYPGTLSAGNKALFGKFISGVLHEIPDLLAVSVIELRSGELVATQHVTGKSNPAKAAAYNAEVIRQKQKAIEALGLSGETIEDILITLNSQWHVLRLLPGNRYFVHLMVSMRDSNLALAREVLREHAAQAS
jgi:hypothetical protein